MIDDQLSNTFAALADPTRRAILARLAAGEAAVTELAEPFDMSMPAVSKHLSVLERAGLIARRRDAQRRPCRIDGAPLKEVAGTPPNLIASSKRNSVPSICTIVPPAVEPASRESSVSVKPLLSVIVDAGGLVSPVAAKLSVKNNRGLTPLSALAQRRSADLLHPSTADLFRKLGAID